MITATIRINEHSIYEIEAVRIDPTGGLPRHGVDCTYRYRVTGQDGDVMGVLVHPYSTALSLTASLCMAILAKVR